MAVLIHSRQVGLTRNMIGRLHVVGVCCTTVFIGWAHFDHAGDWLKKSGPNSIGLKRSVPHVLEISTCLPRV